MNISIPGSKSYTNRALIMAALTPGAVTISNHLMSDDIEAMISCLSALGIRITQTSSTITVHNSIFDLTTRDPQLTTTLDCRQSGTTYRFIVPIAALVPGIHIITGEKRLTQRPIKDLIDALSTLGMQINYSLDTDRCQHICIVGNHDTTHLAREVAISGTISSQFLTAILMIAPVLASGLTIKVTNDLISRPYVDMTISMMEEWGIQVTNDNYQNIKLSPSDYRLTTHNYRVEGDYSAAGYFLAIAALNRQTLTLTNLNPMSKQGDKKFMDFLIREKFISCHFELCQFEPSREPVEKSLSVTGKGIHPVTVDMEEFPDQAQTLAVLVAFAPGVSTLTGVRSLRVKETERVKAIQTELTKMGIQTESPNEDTLIIHGGTPHAATIDTYKDHRMAMSFAVAKTRIPDLAVNNPEVVKKTFPNFWKEYNAMVKCLLDH